MINENQRMWCPDCEKFIVPESYNSPSKSLARQPSEWAYYKEPYTEYICGGCTTIILITPYREE